jgi:hypothetical protein
MDFHKSYVTQSPTPIVLDINEIIRKMYSNVASRDFVLNFYEITTFSNANANANAQTLPMMAVPEYFIHYFYANYKIITLCKATYNLYRFMFIHFNTKINAIINKVKINAIINKVKIREKNDNYFLKIIYFLLYNPSSIIYSMTKHININMASELITNLPLVTDKFLVSCALNHHCDHELKNITISIDNLDINYANLDSLKDIEYKNIHHTRIPKQLWFVLLYSKPLLFDKWFNYYHNDMSSKIYKMIIYSFQKLNREIDVIDFFHHNDLLSASYLMNYKIYQSADYLDAYLLLLFDRADQFGCLILINKIIAELWKNKIKPICFGCTLLKYLNWQNIDYVNHKLDRILSLFINNYTCVKCKSDLLPFIYFRAITRGNIFIDKSNYDKLTYIKVLLREDKMDILFRDYDILKENDKIKLHDTLNFHEIILCRYIYNLRFLDNKNFCKILKKNDFNIDDKILKLFKLTPNFFQCTSVYKKIEDQEFNLAEYLVKIDAFKLFSDDEKIFVIKRFGNSLLKYFSIHDDKYFNQLFKIIPSYGLCMIFWLNIQNIHYEFYCDEIIKIIKLFEENGMSLFKQNIPIQNNMMDYINDPFKNDLLKNIPFVSKIVKALNVPLPYLTHYVQEYHNYRDRDGFHIATNINNFQKYREVIFEYKIPLPLFNEMVLYLDEKSQKKTDDDDIDEKYISRNLKDLKFLLSCSEFNTIKHPDVIKIIDKYKDIINDATNCDEKKKKRSANDSNYSNDSSDDSDDSNDSDDSDDSDDSETKSTKKLKK